MSFSNDNSRSIDDFGALEIRDFCLKMGFTSIERIKLDGNGNPILCFKNGSNIECIKVIPGAYNEILPDGKNIKSYFNNLIVMSENSEINEVDYSICTKSTLGYFFTNKSVSYFYNTRNKNTFEDLISLNQIKHLIMEGCYLPSNKNEFNYRKLNSMYSLETLEIPGSQVEFWFSNFFQFSPKLRSVTLKNTPLDKLYFAMNKVEAILPLEIHIDILFNLGQEVPIHRILIERDLSNVVFSYKNKLIDIEQFRDQSTSDLEYFIFSNFTG
jgi:hypothetical protein